MQIPVRDIVRIYESHDTTVLVDSFIDRINAIDHEIDALHELKRIINRFTQTMMEKGIKHISALPLLYEKLEKQLDMQQNPNNEEEYSFQRLSELSDQVSKPPDLSIVDLPPMRMLSSKMKGTDTSDVDGFWDWLGKNRITFGTPGSHQLFEYQDERTQTIILHSIDRILSMTAPILDDDSTEGYSRWQCLCGRRHCFVSQENDKKL